MRGRGCSASNGFGVPRNLAKSAKGKRFSVNRASGTEAKGVQGKWLDVKRELDMGSKILHRSLDRGLHSVGRKQPLEMFLRLY